MMALASVGTAWAALANRPVAVIVNNMMPELGQPSFTSQTVRVYTTTSLETLAPVNSSLPRVGLFWRLASAGAPSTGWIAPGADLTGWMTGRPDVAGPNGAAWIVMRLNGPLTADAGVICDGEDGAQLWVDGTLDSAACYGGIVRIPTLSAPGPHVIAVRAWHRAHIHPWVDVMVLAFAGRA